MARRKRTKQGNPNRAVGIIRVSTSDQRNGPDAQRDAMDRWCKANGVELVAVFSDIGISGAAPLEKRTGLMDAIAALSEMDCGVLLAAKRDRIARDVMLAGMVERLAKGSGAALMTADGVANDDSPEAVLMKRMQDAFAEYERALTCFRTRAAMRARRKRGLATSHAPYGKAIGPDGALVDNPAEVAVMDVVRELRAAKLNQAQIAKQLTKRGLMNRQGREWKRPQISRMLKAMAA